MWRGGTRHREFGPAPSDAAPPGSEDDNQPAEGRAAPRSGRDPIWPKDSGEPDRYRPPHTTHCECRGFLIPPGRPDGRSIQFNPHKTFHDIGYLQAKEAHPAVSIDQVPSSVTAQSFLHYPNQLGQQQEVILEKGMFRHLPARGFHAEDGLDPALGWRIASPLCDGLVDGRFGDHARLDVAHQATISAYETQVQFLGRLVPLAADQDAVAIMVGVRTRDHRLDHGRIKPTNTTEELADLPVLPTELGGVVDVLVLAPPHSPK